MKKYLAVLLSSLCILFASNSFADTNLVTQQREIPNFTAVDIQSANITTITAGSTASLTVTGNKNAVTPLITEVKNNTLYIYYPSSFPIGGRPNPVMLTITVPELQKLNIAGSSTTNVSQLKTQTLTVSTKGKVQIKLTGTVDTINADLKGETILNAKDLIAKTANLDAAGLAQVQIYASDTIKTNARGDVTVKVFGNPKAVANAASGHSSVSVAE